MSELVKVYVGADEWYPVTTVEIYEESGLTEANFPSTTLPRELVERWYAARAAFDQVCAEIDLEYDRQHPWEPPP
jgi:hypothetical protein